MIEVSKTWRHAPPKSRTGEPVARVEMDYGDTMGLAAIVTVCTGDLWHELREFLPSARVACPDLPIWVCTDRSPGALSVVGKFLGVSEVHHLPARLEVAAKQLSSVATVSPYWSAPAIWCKIDALTTVVKEVAPGAVWLLDCDVTLAAGPERAWYGDVALSPFYWGTLELPVRATPGDPDSPKVPIPHRDGWFNAGMLATRSLEFCRWWMEAYLAGRGGFYEQGVLDEVPSHFLSDYISPLHNWGKWRFASPPIGTLSYHYHLRESAQSAARRDMKLAAQQTAARARHLLSV